jgi:hypothetical protein
MSWHVIGKIEMPFDYTPRSILRLAVRNIFRQRRRTGRLCLRKSEKKMEKRCRMT